QDLDVEVVSMVTVPIHLGSTSVPPLSTPIIDLSPPKPTSSPLLKPLNYTIVSKPRAVIYKDRNDQKKMLRENEVYMFSDGTLTRVLHKLDHMVKDFRLYQYNPGMNNRIWSEDDKRRSEEFMEVIERRLKIQRIF
nr:hypothetical protein [Tanacetum cinerariifolium]